MWWRDAVIYQIYVRSFFDTNGDGIGDISGVTAKLNYLQELGVTVLWLSPIGISPNHDWGYDVADYMGVDPALGTAADLTRLIAEAKDRGMRVILDLVPNHTSTEHPWFKAARSSKTDPHRDWYIWSDGNPDGGKPNNWRSMFGGSAWQLDRTTGQYFLHNFLPQQADLNWANPAVQTEFKRIIKHWFDRGVSGFRIDVVNMLAKDPARRDNPSIVHAATLGVRLLGQEQIYSGNGTAVHAILRDWRHLADGYRDQRLLIGETMVYQPKDLAAYYGHNDELQLGFNFPFWETRFKASALRQVVAATESVMPADAWPAWAASNHDISRAASRWARGNEAKIRLILLLLLTLRGTPVLYYGEELGLTDSHVPRRRYRDQVGKVFWPLFPGRDKERTPMIWDNTKMAGFTVPNGAQPWLPVGTRARNVSDQQRDPASTLRFTRRLITLRQKDDDLRTGPYHELPSSHHVWAYQRGDNTIIVLNMSRHSATFNSAIAKLVLSSVPNRPLASEAGTQVWQLAPWEGIIIRLQST